MVGDAKDPTSDKQEQKAVQTHQLVQQRRRVETNHVFGQLNLTLKQVQLSKLLAEQVLSDLSVAGWPDYVVAPVTTKLLQMWFDGTPTDHLCQMHGLVELDKPANWLCIKDCVDQIVDTSIVHAKLRTCNVDPASWVYTQLASQASFPPVSIDWPGVPELCWLGRAWARWIQTIACRPISFADCVPKWLASQCMVFYAPEKVFQTPTL